jgi:DNA primase
MMTTESILGLIEMDLGPARQQKGRWYFWSCPFHQDRHPSLAATSDNDRWFCFSCRRGGGQAAWYRDYRHTHLPAGDGKLSPATQFASLPVETNQLPNEIWQIRAFTLIAECQQKLWTMTGKPGRYHLYARGLKGLVIDPFQLGYNPNDRFEPLEDWGLEPRYATEQSVFIPAGVCIPWMVGDQVWKINFRRLGKTPKYLQVKGSRPGLFGAETLKDHDIAFLVEGEFDALLLEQEAGDLIGVATLGSASNRNLDGRWLSYLSMGNLSRRLCWTKVPAGKDITEYWRKGGDLKKWITELLSMIHASQNREV